MEYQQFILINPNTKVSLTDHSKRQLNENAS